MNLLVALAKVLPKYNMGRSVRKYVLIKADKNLDFPAETPLLQGYWNLLLMHIVILVTGGNQEILLEVPQISSNMGVNQLNACIIALESETLWIMCKIW